MSADGHDRPDVYYVILDRYANSWTLANLYGYDNTPFLEALRERGFYVADEAWANYFKTAFSVSSSLDMRTSTAMPWPRARSSDRSSDRSTPRSAAIWLDR